MPSPLATTPARPLAAAALLLLAPLSPGCSRKPSTETAQPAARASAAPLAARRAASARPRAPAPPAGPLVVPRAREAIVINESPDEPSWQTSARTGSFTDTQTGQLSQPYSDARFLWDDAYLYIVLYAGDENVMNSVREHDGPVWQEDAFVLRFRPAGDGDWFGLDIGANQTVTDYREDRAGKRDLGWESHIKVSIDVDGSLNKPDDEDEEWVVESALPWSSLGPPPRPGQRYAMQISRCDTPHESKRRCGEWKGELELSASPAAPVPALSAPALPAPSR